jgi:hypothetical protein
MPWILCIAQDHQLQKRMADWLADIATVESANNLAGAQALVDRRGLPHVVLANPESQGSADDFCVQLQTMLASQRVVLMSDALNAAFAARYKMGWLPATSLPRKAILDKVSAVLATP